MKDIGEIRSDLRYTPTHEWVRLEGSVATIGITDYAQRELTDIVYVELPELNKQVNAGECAAVLESVKAASEVYAPLSGKVVEVNTHLEQEPGLINQDPYGKGWLFRLEVSDDSEFEKLLDAAAYRTGLMQQSD